MRTSYFASRVAENKVAICRIVPSWFMGPEYDILAPPTKLLNDYLNQRVSESEFRAHYEGNVLSRLDARTVYDDIVSKYGEDATLTCYEKSGKFCHRRIVAQWFKKELSIDVPEVGANSYPTLFEVDHE